jgi:hypothetical protein
VSALTLQIILFEMKIFVAFCILFFNYVATVLAQEERVYLQMDKYSGAPGDTVWFKGYVFDGERLSRKSTNLYVGLFTEKGRPLRNKVFPIINGESEGQVIVPDSIVSGTYFVRAFTRSQLDYDTIDLFSAPMAIYNPNRGKFLFHKRRIPTNNNVVGGYVKGIYWSTTTYHGTEWSSLLQADSPMTNPRYFRILKRLSGDSVLQVDVTLGPGKNQQYSLFPLDSNQENERFFLLEDSSLLARQIFYMKDAADSLSLVSDTLNTAPQGYNSWQLILPDSGYSYSVCVTDADRTAEVPTDIRQVKESRMENLTTLIKQMDTSFIALDGIATRQSGRVIKDISSRTLLVAGFQDSSFLFARTVEVDSVGRFRIDSLFFFDALSLQFQINKVNVRNPKDIRLNLVRFTQPLPDSKYFSRFWEDDGQPINATDTAFTKSELTAYELSKEETLKPAIVHGWKNSRQELDDQYTTGPFSEPALYFYDLRMDSSDYDRDVFWYIDARNGRLRYDVRGDSLYDVMGHPIHYFINEQECTPGILRVFDFDRLAYIKILESDFLSIDRNEFNLMSGFSSSPGQMVSLRSPVVKTAINVCVYTRNGRDYRTMRGGMNMMMIQGYSRIIPFHSDRRALYWVPFARGNRLRVRFQNSDDCRRFRIMVEGVNGNGNIVHYERILD